MGYTKAINFPNAPVKPDTFYSGLTTVFSAPTWVINNSDKAGNWIKFPTVPNSFKYWANKDSAKWDTSKGRNFVVDYVPGTPPGPDNGFDVYISRNTTLRRRIAGSVADVTSLSTGGPLIDFGFDIGPPILGIEEASGFSSLSLFPNPAVNGRFAVSLDARRPLSEVAVTVSSITGQPVLSRAYQCAGSSFTKSWILTARRPASTS